MSNTKKIPMLLKILFILLFLVSISLNVALKNNLAKSDESIDKMYNYKKAYMKIIDVLGVPPEQSEQLLKSGKSYSLELPSRLKIAGISFNWGQK